MATSIEQVREFLDEFDLHYAVDEKRRAILIGFGLDPDATSYRDREGDPYIRLVIRLMEDGDFLSIFCPWAWNVERCPHKAAVFEAIAAIQGRYKLLRFDYDPTDGEIRPNVEMPLEDADLTSRQFHRLMQGIFFGVQRFDGVIRHAMQTGEVSFASAEDDEPQAAPHPELVRLQHLATEAGGLEALERIACGCGGDEQAGDRAGETAAEQPRPADAESGSIDAPPTPNPVIRGIWQWLFGGDDRESGSARRAG